MIENLEKVINKKLEVMASGHTISSAAEIATMINVIVDLKKLKHSSFEGRSNADISVSSDLDKTIVETLYNFVKDLSEPEKETFYHLVQVAVLQAKGNTEKPTNKN